MSPKKTSFPKQDIRVLLLEGVSQTAVEVFSAAGYSQIEAHTKALPEDELKANMALCAKYGVEIIISVGGDPTELIGRVHGFGGKVFHDITSLRFAEKAIAAGDKKE